MLKFGRSAKYYERRIAITKNNISIVLQSEDPIEHMDYLIKKAFEIFDKEDGKNSNDLM
jgi:hypothetical protein